MLMRSTPLFLRPARLASALLVGVIACILDAEAQTTIDFAEIRATCAGIRQVVVGGEAKGEVTYKDLEVEVDASANQLTIRDEGVLLAQVDDFTFESYTQCVSDLAGILANIRKEQQGLIRSLTINTLAMCEVEYPDNWEVLYDDLNGSVALHASRGNLLGEHGFKVEFQKLSSYAAKCAEFDQNTPAKKVVNGLCVRNFVYDFAGVQSSNDVKVGYSELRHVIDYEDGAKMNTSIADVYGSGSRYVMVLALLDRSDPYVSPGDSVTQLNIQCSAEAGIDYGIFIDACQAVTELTTMKRGLLSDMWCANR